MARLHIEATTNTPEVLFDSEKRVFTIVGKAFPENAHKFFLPLVDWLKDYMPEGDCILNIQLDYLSSSSVIALLELIKKLEYLENRNILIQWSYEEGDDDMEIIGKDYEKIANLKFKFIQFSE